MNSQVCQRAKIALLARKVCLDKYLGSKQPRKEIARKGAASNVDLTRKIKQRIETSIPLERAHEADKVDMQQIGR